MHGRRIFTVGEEAQEVTQDAYRLAKIVYPDSAPQVVNAAKQGCMHGLTQDELKSLVFLGHGNMHDYGGYDAKHFAKKIASQLDAKQKKSVEHVYLLGCDMGLIHTDGQSLAQDIANELFKNGLINHCVHCIAKPEDAIGEALYVEIIEHVGLSHFTSTAKEGYLNAFLLSHEEAERFDLLCQDRKKHAKEIHEIKQEKAFKFIKDAHPIIELNKPHHLFVPQEQRRARQKRISEHPYTQLADKQIKTIELLKRRRDYELEKKDKKLVRKLDFIITQLNRAEAEEWQSMMGDFVSYLQVGLFGIAFNKNSRTFQLLTYLSQGDFDEAQKMVDNQSPKKKQLTEQTIVHQKEKNTLTESLQLIKIKEAMTALIHELDNEITALNSTCFSFFNRYEINTKMRKKEVLIQLGALNTLQTMQLKAADLLHDARAIRSHQSTRTRDLLVLIVQHPEVLLEKARKEVKTKYGYKRL